MKNLIVAGTIGKDAILRRTNAGDPVLHFSIAVDDGYGDKKTTMWFDVSMFGKRGQALHPFMKKGTKITASGDFGTREHEGKTYFMCRAHDITIQWSPKETTERHANSNQPDRDDYASRTKVAAGAFLDDDIPFAPEWR